MRVREGDIGVRNIEMCSEREQLFGKSCLILTLRVLIGNFLRQLVS